MNNKTPPLDAVATLVERYSTLLYRHSLVMLGRPSDAEDVVQETFLRYMQKAPRLNGEEHEKAWLLTVAMNLCRNQLRQRKAHPHIDLDSCPEPTAPTQDTPVLDALSALPDKVRIVVLLHYVEGYKVREIAARLRLTPSAVKMRLQKGRQLLREYIKEEDL